MGVKGLSLSAFFGGLITTVLGLFIGLGVAQNDPDLINPAIYFPLIIGTGAAAGLATPIVMTWIDHRFEFIAVLPQKWLSSIDRPSIASHVRVWGQMQHQKDQLKQIRSEFNAFDDYVDAYQESIDYELDILKSSIATITTDIDRAVADDLFARARP